MGHRRAAVPIALSPRLATYKRRIKAGATRSGDHPGDGRRDARRRHLLALPRPPRTRTHLTSRRPGRLRPHRWIGDLTRNELHPPQFGLTSLNVRPNSRRQGIRTPQHASPPVPRQETPEGQQEWNSEPGSGHHRCPVPHLSGRASVSSHSERRDGLPLVGDWRRSVRRPQQRPSSCRPRPAP